MKVEVDFFILPLFQINFPPLNNLISLFITLTSFYLFIQLLAGTTLTLVR